MDIVFIRELKIDTVIGIYDWEKRVKQTVSLNIDMGTDISKAAGSDHIDDAVSYKTVAKRVAEFVSESHHELVESLAENVCQLIRDEFPVSWVRLELHKPRAVSTASSVGVIIERGEKS